MAENINNSNISKAEKIHKVNIKREDSFKCNLHGVLLWAVHELDGVYDILAGDDPRNQIECVKRTMGIKYIYTYNKGVVSIIVRDFRDKKQD